MGSSRLLLKASSMMCYLPDRWLDHLLEEGNAYLVQQETVSMSTLLLTVLALVEVQQGDASAEAGVISLPLDELNAYLTTGDWEGKAGAYAIQGPAGAFIPWISGSFTGIVGLPLAETATLLQSAGYPLYKDKAP